MKKLSYLQLVSSMTIFGTIGIFVKLIPAERGFIAMLRGFIGVAVLLSFMLIMRKKPSFTAIKKNLVLLLLSGAAIGANWIFLFESYSYTTVAISTLCYYMAPVFVIIASPFVTGERITPLRGGCVLLSVLGMVLVSGVAEGHGDALGSLLGVALALGAALLYASVTLMNKRIRDIEPEDMTVCQLFFAALVILPYTLFAEGNNLSSLDSTAWLAIIAVGVIHTGLAYLLYFSSLRSLPAQTVAIFSYLDPIVAILLSVFLLNEGISVLAIIGAVFILASTLVAALFGNRSKEPK